jgi:hypothetical protein
MEGLEQTDCHRHLHCIGLHQERNSPSRSKVLDYLFTLSIGNQLCDPSQFPDLFDTPLRDRPNIASAVITYRARPICHQSIGLE